MPASNGCSSPLFLNNPSLFWRCLWHRHVFLTHLNMIYPPFMYFLWDRLPRLFECTPTALRVCVSALENERGIRWLFFPYSSPCAITVLIMWLTVKPPVSIHCADSSLYNFPSSVRKGMAVSTITAVKAGLLLFSGPETARYARWCNTYKGVFSPIFSWRSRRLSHGFLMGMLLSSSFLYIL